MSLYTVLDVSEDCSDFVLEQAFRTRSLQFLATLDSRDHREFYAVSDAFQILRKHRKEYNENTSNLYWLSDQLQLTTPAVEYFCKLFGMPQMEPFIGPVPVLHWMLNLAPEFPFVDREIKHIPNHILNMLDRARDKRPYDSTSDNHRYRRQKSRDQHSLFVDPYLRHVSSQAYVLERGHELDVSAQVDRLRFLLDVDREGDSNFWEQKWESFRSVHPVQEDEEDESEEEDDHVTNREECCPMESHCAHKSDTDSTHVTDDDDKSGHEDKSDHVTHITPSDSETTLSDPPMSPRTTRRFGGRLRSFIKRHRRRARDKLRERANSRESSRDSSLSRQTSRDSTVSSAPSLGRFSVKSGHASGAAKIGDGDNQSERSVDGDGKSTGADVGGKAEVDRAEGEKTDGDKTEGESEKTEGSKNNHSDNPSFSSTFQHRFQNELNLIVDHPFAPSVFQATGTMFKLRSKGLVRQYLPNLPFRGSHFEQAKQSARAILLMDRCVDARDRCLKINDFWGKYGLSSKDQTNFMYTTCFYELIREVAMNANRMVSQLFEDDETKVRRKFKRQRAHRLWVMGDWLVKRGAELAAERGIDVVHNPSIKPDDVVSSIVALVSYMEFVVINHRPYQTQTRINYRFVKQAVEGGHVTGDLSDPVRKAAASLWTPWAVASCNPLAISDPDQAEEFSSFDFRYEDVFKKKKDQCECGVALFE
ncbi:hypothetical protein CJU89_5652 [Yarrowia sp. B02]|nr:hypothetical protein CJU89_5652 [Yarrowia sp. B02]